MTQIATTEAQSLRLLEAGIDPQTADMQWNAIPTHHGVEEELFVGEKTPNGLPAWSLSALVQLCAERNKEFAFGVGEGGVEELFGSIVNYLCKKL